jgi:hypothetical protein
LESRTAVKEEDADAVSIMATSTQFSFSGSPWPLLQLLFRHRTLSEFTTVDPFTR